MGRQNNGRTEVDEPRDDKNEVASDSTRRMRGAQKSIEVAQRVRESNSIERFRIIARSCRKCMVQKRLVVNWLSNAFVEIAQIDAVRVSELPSRRLAIVCDEIRRVWDQAV